MAGCEGSNFLCFETKSTKNKFIHSIAVQTDSDCDSRSSNSSSSSSIVELSPRENPRRALAASSSSSSSSSSPLLFSPVSRLPSRSNEGNESRCLFSFRAHQGRISAMAVTDDLLYTGSDDNQIRVWRRADIAEIGPLGSSGDGAVKALIVDGKRIFSAHQDHKIRAWKRCSSSYHDHKMLGVIPTLKEYISSAVLPKNYVRIRRHHKRLWNEHFDTISVLTIGMGEDPILYSGSWDRTIKVWRISDFKCLESIDDAHDDAINAMVVAQNSGIVFSGSADKSIKAWKRQQQQHELVATMMHASSVNALAMSSCGGVLYAGCSDGTISMWERRGNAGECWGLSDVLKGHKGAVLSLAMAETSDGRELIMCSGSADKSVRIWSRARNVEYSRNVGIVVLQGHSSPVKCVYLSLEDVVDGCVVYGGGLDGCLKVWWASLNNNKRSSNSPCSVLEYAS